MLFAAPSAHASCSHLFVLGGLASETSPHPLLRKIKHDLANLALVKEFVVLPGGGRRGTPNCSERKVLLDVRERLGVEKDK